MTLRKINGYYYVIIRTAGHRKRISTRCKDRGAAMRVVRESSIKELEQAALAGRLTQEAIGQIVTGRKVKMDSALEPFESWMKACARAQKTIDNCMVTVRHWVREMKLGALPPSAITAEHISRWVNNPESRKKSGSRNVALSCIRSLFSFMAANGWVVSDVSRLVNVDMSVMSHEQKERTERQPFTDEEVAKLLEYLDNNGETFWHFAVLCSKETGLRLSDVCGLELKCFTALGEGGIQMTVWTEKTNRRMKFVMSAALIEAFQKVIPLNPRFLFPEQRGMIIDLKKRGVLSINFKRICEKLGIKDKSFHCLRHRRLDTDNIDETAKRLAKHLELKDMQKLLGHSTTSMTEKYAH